MQQTYSDNNYTSNVNNNVGNDFKPPPINTFNNNGISNNTNTYGYNNNMSKIN
jgi:hypothetical protein